MKKFWQKRKVFISGINGFVGANLAKFLIAKGLRYSALLEIITHIAFVF